MRSLRRKSSRLRKQRIWLPARQGGYCRGMRKRLAVLREFAPEEMSEEAIRKEINEVLAGLGIVTPTVERTKGNYEGAYAESQRERRTAPLSTGLWEKLLSSRSIRLASYLPDMVLQPMFNKITATIMLPDGCK